MLKRSLSRLGGWYRLGVVLTVIWLLFVLAAAVYEWLFAATPGPLVTFSADAYLQGRRAVVPHALHLFFALIVFPAIAWVAVWAASFACRRVAAGFLHATRDSTVELFADKSDKELCEWIAGYNEQSGLGFRLLGNHELQRRLRRPDAIRSWIAVGISIIALLVAILTQLARTHP